MPRLIAAPVVIEAAGTKLKLIEEFVGGPSTGTTAVSVARMRSPSGWEEPGQRPDFQEITVCSRATCASRPKGATWTSPPARR